MKKLTLATLVLAIPFAAQANLVANGSFEDHAALTHTSGGGNWDLFDSIPAWFAESDKIEIGSGSVYGVTGYSGNDVLELDANHNAKVSQNVALSAGDYAVSLDFARRDGVAFDSVGFDVLWNDAVVASFSPTSVAMASWSGTVTALAGTNKLSLRGTGVDDSYGATVDNVSLAAVPEPGSLVAMGAGAVALFGRRRRRD